MLLRHLLFFVLSTLFILLNSAYSYERNYNSSLIGKSYHCITKRIIDGDTVETFCKLYPEKYYKVRIRIASIDTFESRYNKRAIKQTRLYRLTLREVLQKGKAAKLILQQLLPVNSPFTCELEDIGKYGRLICTIKNKDNIDVSVHMICSGNANPFMVRKKHLDKFRQCLKYKKGQ